MSTQSGPLPRKCKMCKKKLPLTAFPCRCGGMYCASHRMDNDHGCTYDYKQEAANLLSTTLVKIQAQKVEII